MADIFDVVADATRRDLLHALLERYSSIDSATGEISVGELVDRLGVSQPTVSKHLKVLREHSMVTVREEGQHRYYRLEASPLEELEDWLIPFLSADFDAQETAAYAAWAGTEVGSNLGRATAERLHQARTTIHDAQEQVTKRLPWRKKK
ncbi:metalloregulator ArsR/SmtB family transcription factor [Salinibacterium sp. ZJ454]|uniref:ArsR/SmtB family transcription factor n=1 Tax=Salinibacterium sp. ZJ454 TaxID=2708339 RepID=UPI00141EE8CB|nr:metalloregulator ArsR/SmtB family transcription factor [Salinibacterium sp. ZJ454]